MEDTTSEKKTRKKALARRDYRGYNVRVFPEEQAIIANNAKMAGLSVPEFLRRLGLGANIKPVIDPVIGRQIIKHAGEIGKVGGLLKMLLSNSERFGGTRGEVLQIQTEKLLNEINDARAKLVSVIKSLNR